MAAFAVAAALQGVQLLTAFSARGKRRRASKLQRASVQITNVQRKRAFLNRFRDAQAQALVSAASTGASLESSGIQGTLASQRTQAEQGLFEFETQADLARRAGSLQASAASAEFIGGVAGAAASTVQALPNPTEA